MPTPFTHLRITHRLLNDPEIPDSAHKLLNLYSADFYLGGVVADARPEGSRRADTHFYDYTEPMPDKLWREMFRHHPSLRQTQTEAHQVFLMAYVAHLASDEYWSLHLLKPHIAEANWDKDVYERFKSLHLLLIHMDERDEKWLPAFIPSSLRRSSPKSWLPFINDTVICQWRDFIADQLATGVSQTLQIFGSRIHTPPKDIRAMLNNNAVMQQRLWNHLAPSLIAEIEEQMYQFSQQQMLIYLNEFFSY
jgi:hypothetical protein